MLIAQASDLHLHADRDHLNHERFVRTLDHLLTIEPLPDLLILSGDLADAGEPEAYQLLRKALERWPRPVHLMVGNHDDRDQLRTVFPEVPVEGGFIQYAIGAAGLRLILLDTTEPGREGGAFCAQRRDWLRGQLASASGETVLIFMHHPPAELGLPWIDPRSGQEWVERFWSALDGYHVAAICTGHVHASASARCNGTSVVTCPSTSSDLSLMFEGMDASRPDSRPLVERSEPAFALHRWSNQQVVTFAGRCPREIIANWDKQSRALVARMLAERDS